MTTVMADETTFDPAQLWSTWQKGGQNANYVAWKVQTALNAVLANGPYSGLQADGYIGPATQQALYAVTGSYYITPQSLQALDYKLSGLSPQQVESNKVRHYAYEAYWDGALQDAEGYALYSMQLFPNVIASNLLGNIHYGQGQWAKAAQDYQYVAQNTSPTNPIGAYAGGRMAYANWQAAGGSAYALADGKTPKNVATVDPVLRSAPGASWWDERSTNEKVALVAGGLGLLALIGVAVSK